MDENYFSMIKKFYLKDNYFLKYLICICDRCGPWKWIWMKTNQLTTFGERWLFFSAVTDTQVILVELQVGSWSLKSFSLPLSHSRVRFIKIIITAICSLFLSWLLFMMMGKLVSKKESSCYPLMFWTRHVTPATRLISTNSTLVSLLSFITLFPSTPLFLPVSIPNKQQGRFIMIISLHISEFTQCLIELI